MKAVRAVLSTTVSLVADAADMHEPLTVNQTFLPLTRPPTCTQSVRLG